MSNFDSLSVLVTPEYAIGAVAFLMSMGGIILLREVNRKDNSPLAPYIIQILGLCFILPVLLLTAIVTELPGEAITGLLGTIVGYIFDRSQDESRRRGSRERMDNDARDE